MVSVLAYSIALEVGVSHHKLLERATSKSWSRGKVARVRQLLNLEVIHTVVQAAQPRRHLRQAIHKIAVESLHHTCRNGIERSQQLVSRQPARPQQRRQLQPLGIQLIPLRGNVSLVDLALVSYFDMLHTTWRRKPHDYRYRVSGP